MINQKLTEAQRYQRVTHNGFSLSQLKWSLLASKESKGLACMHHATVIDLTENYNNFSGRFSYHWRASRESLVNAGWNALIEDWGDFNPDAILETVEVKRLESILTGRAEILYEVGGRSGNPGERVDGLGYMRCTISFSEQSDYEAWCKQ